jgi:hypothetical protein
MSLPRPWPSVNNIFCLSGFVEAVLSPGCHLLFELHKKTHKNLHNGNQHRLLRHKIST